MAPGEGALSARTVLEVADGLRWSDARLGLSLAEHALRLAGDDAGVRAAAQRSVIRSLAEVDRFDEVVARATPLLEDAVVRGDRDDLAGLLVELAAAAVGFGDHAVAAHLVEPVGPGDGLPDRTVAKAALVRAQLAGVGGDVPGADRTASEAEAALQHTDEPEAGLVRRDLARARAAARRRSGDAGAALPIVSAAVSADPRADADGGRRSLLAAADQIDLLLDLGRSTEALERARTILPADPTGPLVVGAVAAGSGSRSPSASTSRVAPPAKRRPPRARPRTSSRARVTTRLRRGPGRSSRPRPSAAATSGRRSPPCATDTTWSRVPVIAVIRRYASSP